MSFVVFNCYWFCGDTLGVGLGVANEQLCICIDKGDLRYLVVYLSH